MPDDSPAYVLAERAVWHLLEKKCEDLVILDLRGRSDLQPSATLCIRVKKFNPNDSCTGLSEDLRLVTLAEVKWCREVSGENTSQYVIGVKYFAPAY